MTIEAVRNFHTDSETSPLSVILRRRYKDLDLSARNDRGETAANVAAKLTSEKLKFLTNVIHHYIIIRIYIIVNDQCLSS